MTLHGLGTHPGQFDDLPPSGCTAKLPNTPIYSSRKGVFSLLNQLTGSI
jgi:hypothetical protein